MAAVLSSALNSGAKASRTSCPAGSGEVAPDESAGVVEPDALGRTPWAGGRGGSGGASSLAGAAGSAGSGTGPAADGGGAGDGRRLAATAYTHDARRGDTRSLPALSSSCSRAAGGAFSPASGSRDGSCAPHQRTARGARRRAVRTMISPRRDGRRCCNRDGANRWMGRKHSCSLPLRLQGSSTGRPEPDSLSAASNTSEFARTMTFTFFSWNAALQPQRAPRHCTQYLQLQRVVCVRPVQRTQEELRGRALLVTPHATAYAQGPWPAANAPLHRRARRG
jgi:hypothetical protein